MPTAYGYYYFLFLYVPRVSGVVLKYDILTVTGRKHVASGSFEKFASDVNNFGFISADF